ncbi:MAG TPA: type II toxin-antitoxin system RelE/ParE family toxin [Xanthobacteraceae bacterium]|jgi:mRNA-degrading endonuclease RelE of RelBE toxin-antitoxin system
MPWGLAITKPADRDLRRLSPNDLRRVNAAFEAMRRDPYGGDVKFLAGTAGTLRRRVGAWRIFFEVHQQRRTIVVLAVRRRTSTTYRG